ncbi:MAG: hypothetical protein V1729_05745 [Candidatus Woesearchaeota archaeon]
MAEGDTTKRQVAHKVRIADILNNRYVKEDGWLPNYISVGAKKVSRANILGVIVSKDAQEGSQAPNFMLDDGTGRLSLKFFEQGNSLDVGDIVGVIGRPREFGAERYLVPEIIRKISNSKWIEVRKLELALSLHNTKKEEHSNAPVVLDTEEETIEETNPLSQIAEIIKREDSGSGVSFEEISVKFSGSDPEEYVKRLLEQGDIFEVKPGRYKVLE